MLGEIFIHEHGFERFFHANSFTISAGKILYDSMSNKLLYIFCHQKVMPSNTMFVTKKLNAGVELPRSHLTRVPVAIC